MIHELQPKLVILLLGLARDDFPTQTPWPSRDGQLVHVLASVARLARHVDGRSVDKVLLMPLAFNTTSHTSDAATSRSFSAPCDVCILILHYRDSQLVLE